MTQGSIDKCWSQKKAVINGWLGIPSAFSAEIIASSGGYDSLTIDMQHGLADQQVVLSILQALRASECEVLVRVPWLEPGIIMKVLDMGADGIICPMINQSSDAARLVTYCYYPPDGERSFGPIRAGMLSANYAKEANTRIKCFAMVETKMAMSDLSAIVSTPGLTGVYIGPSDLSLSYGYDSGQDRKEPELVDHIQTIMRSSHAVNKKACLHTASPEYAAKAIGWGFDLVTVQSDARLLAAATKESVEATRKLAGDRVRKPGDDAMSSRETGY